MMVTQKMALAILSVVVVVVILVAIIIVPLAVEKEKNDRPSAIIDSPTEGSAFSVNDEIEFAAVSSSDPDGDKLSYYWSSNISGEFGDEKSFLSRLDIGKHEIQLIVKDTSGAEDFTLINISVFPIPSVVSDFPGTDKEYYSTEFILFNASNCSSDYASTLNFTWRSDIDGILGFSEILETNLSLGTHTITLEVSDGLSKNEKEFVIEILKNKLPVASITSPKYNEVFLIDSEIYFDCSACIDPDGHDLFYSWTSNIDGLIGTAETFYANLSAGTHIIELIVTDEHDGKSETSLVLIVNTPPTADAGDNKNSEVDEKVNFDGSLSTDPDGDELTYTWNFGDGNKDVGKKVEHPYDLEDVYNVTLTVDDGKGGRDNDSILITVIHVFKGTGVFGHVYDNETEEPLEGVWVDIYGMNWYDDFDEGTETDGSGYFEFNTPEGEYWLDIYGEDGYYSYSDEVTVVKNKGTEVDIPLDKVPPETARIFGYVYDDETQEPLEDADITVYNERDHYNYTYSDSDGFYEMNVPPGKFSLGCYYFISEDIEYDYYYKEIELSEDQDLRLDIYLKRFRPGISNTTFEFTSWDSIEVYIITTQYSSIYTSFTRQSIDENGNGEITEIEVTAYETMMEAMITDIVSNEGSRELLLVDDIDYVLFGNVDYEIEGAVGPTDSTGPLIEIIEMTLKSNHTIPISDTHVIKLNIEYDGPSFMLFNYTVILPSLPFQYEMTNYTASPAVNVTNNTLTNEIYIDPGQDPNPMDDIYSEWVEIEVKRKT